MTTRYECIGQVTTYYSFTCRCEQNIELLAQFTPKMCTLLLQQTRIMWKVLLSLFLALVLPSVHAAPALITPDQLQQALKAQTTKPGRALIRLIDIRDEFSCEQDHIPGSLNAPYNQWRGPASNPGQVPELAKLKALVNKLGIEPNQHVVVVSTGEDALDFGAAARVYWTLKYLGLTELSVLQGGVFAWDEANLPLESGPANWPTPSHFSPQAQTQWLASTDEVHGFVKGSKARLVDARPLDFFKGNTRVPQAKAAGTLPGAVHLDNERWFDRDGAKLISVQQSRDLAKDLQITPNQPTVLFCNTGHLAATNWFMLSEVLGLPQVKLYTGSLVEWTQHPQALPMANEPGRVRQLWMDAQFWYRQRFE